MPISDPDLWAAIGDWPLPNATVEGGLFHPRTETVSFAEGLTEGGKLLRSSAEGVEAEYRRWLTLCAVAGRRLQGSDWILAAENAHRADAANWRALLDGPLSGVDMGDPVPRGPANDEAYAETLSLYARAFPEGELFGKVWPALWQVRFARTRPVAVCLVAVLAGGALLSLGGPPAVLGVGVVIVALALMALASLASPWEGDDNGG